MTRRLASLTLALAAVSIGLPAWSQQAETATPPTEQGQTSDPTTGENAAPKMPERERALIDIFEDGRHQYDSGHAGVKSKDIRIGLQIRIIEYMESSQDAKEWIGSVKTRGTTPEGDAWITIEIADGITVSTWQTHFFDQNQATLIPNYSPLFEVAHNLKIGQSVVFSGKIVEAVTSTDEEMIVRPQLIARFNSIKAFE